MTKHNATKCSKIIRDVLCEDTINEIGKETLFSRRVRKLTPYRTAWTFIVGMASGNIHTLSDLRRLFNILSKESMAYKPFHDRLSTIGFPEFFRELLEHLMSELLTPVYGCKNGYLKEFEDILIQDGSSLSLNDKLSTSFKGRFSNNSPAAVEIHCLYSLYNNQCESVAIAPDHQGERDFLPEPQDLKSKLLLIDAGYVSTAYFKQVEEAGGHYIGKPNSPTSNPRIISCYSGIAKSAAIVGKRLKDIKLPRRHVDLQVEMLDRKRKRSEFRLVGVYVPKKKKHVWLYTSLSPKKYPPLRVGTLYRLRWQIELFFKECKSYTNLKEFQTAKPRIAEGLIWASLTACLVRRFLLHSAFKGTNKREAPFVGGAMAWTYVLNLGNSALNGYRKLAKVLGEILETLFALAKRTNLNRKDSWKELKIYPNSMSP